MSTIPSLSQLGPAFRDAHPTLSQDRATAEADACLQCGGPCAPAPCTSACPAGVDVPGFIGEIAQGRPIDAARRILRDNILGGTCAHVCPTDVLCEGACVLRKEGRRAIRRLGLQFMPRMPRHPHIRLRQNILPPLRIPVTDILQNPRPIRQR